MRWIVLLSLFGIGIFSQAAADSPKQPPLAAKPAVWTLPAAQGQDTYSEQYLAVGVSSPNTVCLCSTQGATETYVWVKMLKPGVTDIGGAGSDGVLTTKIFTGSCLIARTAMLWANTADAKQTASGTLNQACP